MQREDCFTKSAESNGSFIQNKMAMPLNNIFFLLYNGLILSHLLEWFLLSVNFPYSQGKVGMVSSNISNLPLSEMLSRPNL